MIWPSIIVVANGSDAPDYIQPSPKKQNRVPIRQMYDRPYQVHSESPTLLATRLGPELRTRFPASALH
jgi:hypothetical protein